ncbi:cullin-associated NEDD8-dissociated protein 1-like protein [Paraphysoderma sedebokerense]|nr:cullin-associated NEDD8-dissociated protein 1-like protein [Paraphysoderma sedebokerense]
MASTYILSPLLEKMSSSDADFRYMAINDLMTELSKESFVFDESTEKRIVTAIMKLFEDSNGEVQNMAVKCLSPLVMKVREPSLQEIADKLCSFLVETKREELRDVASIGLKTVIVEFPTNSPIAANLCRRLVPKLLAQLNNTSLQETVHIDILDVLSDVLSRYGSTLATQGSTDMFNQMQMAILPLVTKARPAVRKRASLVIGNLAAHSTDDLFTALMKRLLEDLKKEQSHEKLRTLIMCIGTVSRFASQKLGGYLPQIVPIVLKYSSEEDDELRENCLQALEFFVLRCPAQMSPHVQSIVNICTEYVRYDPNYADDDEEEENADEMETDEGGSDDEDEDEEDYSDDEDMSWKVRRASAKLLSSIVVTRGDLLADLIKSVGVTLIKRFKEREESVRADILQTYVALVRQTATYKHHAMDMDVDDSPPAMLRSQIPLLTKALSKQMNAKSSLKPHSNTRQIGFNLLRELVLAVPGCLDNEISHFIPAIQSSLAAATSQHHVLHTNTNLKIEVHAFLRAFFRSAVKPAAIHPYIEKLAPVIIRSVEDRFYKIASEALLVCMELVKIMRPISVKSDGKNYDISPIPANSTTFVQQLYQTTLARLSAPDEEVKDKAILCLGAIIYQVGDCLQSDINEWGPVLLERLKNEVTRLTAVKTVVQIAQCPLPKVDVSSLMGSIVFETATFLRKSHRGLRDSSLKCLDVIIKRYSQSLSKDHYNLIIAELQPLISDSDLHLLPLALSTSVSIMKANPTMVSEVKSRLLPSVFTLVQSPLVQGTAALDTLLSFFSTIIKSSQDQDFQQLLDGLLAPAMKPQTADNALSKQALSTIAQCVAELCINSQPNCLKTVRSFIDAITNPSTIESFKYLSLLTVGEVGRRCDLSSQNDLPQVLLSLFSAPSEDIKSAAAFSLGCVAVGNVNAYLPMIIQEIKRQSVKKYLLFHAIKEVITRYSHHEGGQTLENFASEIWRLLFENCEGQEEGTRIVIAECLGKLTLTNATKFLPELQSRLQSPSAEIRATVIGAIKYTFTDHTQKSDELLRPLIVNFLSLMQDKDLNVRRVALATLNSAAHNKPYLIRDRLSELLPLLYRETVVRPELIHTVEMGPFKHQVDDGLETRKSAFECMYTLMENCLDRIDIFGFLERMFVGMNDQHDIKMLSFMMLAKLATVNPTAVQQRVDEAVDLFRATLFKELKQSAVKQEVEKNQELVRSGLKSLVHLHKLADPAQTPKLDAFLKEIQTSSLNQEYKSLLLETERTADVY